MVMIPKSQPKIRPVLTYALYGRNPKFYTRLMRNKSLFLPFMVSAVIFSACATQSEAKAAAAEAPKPELVQDVTPIAEAAPMVESAPTITEPVVTEAPILVAETRPEKFARWKQDFINRAILQGHDGNLVRSIILPAKITEKALDRDSKQPEFSKPIWSYVDGAASADRLNKGRAKLGENPTLFTQVEDRYKVSRHYLTAIWGLESAYGKIQGDYDVIDALATFAHDGRRTKFGEQQLFAVLDMLARGDVRRDQLKGSWAGAMGMTQFIPATMRDYAVDFDNNANIDLRGSKADALGSAAHYLSRHGWRWGEPAMTEIALPAGFDYILSDGSKRTVNEWTALGVRPAGGQNWSQGAGFLDAKLLVPAGHKGPKFLTFKNFDVIKKYNNSTSYAMGITQLAETFQGVRLFSTPWPRADKQISFTQKKQMQARLTALGYDTKGVDGQIGPNSRRAIRAWQKANGLVADGYVNLSVWTKMMGR